MQSKQIAYDMLSELYGKDGHDKTEAWNRKNAEKQGIIFEKQVEEQTASDSHITFDNYCDYAIGIKEQTGLSPSTVYTYNGYRQRVALILCTLNVYLQNMKEYGIIYLLL